jgi:hypothetical protein
VNYRNINPAGRRLLLALLWMFTFLQGNPYAQEWEDPRIWAGLDLFPSLVAADQDIARKYGPDGKLFLVLMYVDERQTAEEMALYLAKIEHIRGIPIRIELTDDTSMKSYEDIPLAGIFLTQRLGRELGDVIRYGMEHHTIVFSPFEGDLERGVLGGIAISDRILPYVNMEAMRSWGIRIKGFFLRIAERYE